MHKMKLQKKPEFFENDKFMVYNLWIPISQNISQCVLLNLVNYRSIPDLGEVLFSGAIDPPRYVLKKHLVAEVHYEVSHWEVFLDGIPWFLVIPSHINIQHRGLARLILRMEFFLIDFRNEGKALLCQLQETMVRKRKDLRKVNISSTFATIVEKSEKDLEPYLLFSCHSNFTRSIMIGILLNMLKNRKKKTNKHCKVTS